VPRESDVCVIGHALCIRISRTFAERQTRDAKIIYFLLKCVTQTGNNYERIGNMNALAGYGQFKIDENALSPIRSYITTMYMYMYSHNGVH